MKSLFLFFILFGGWSVEGSVGVVRGPVRRWSADWSAVGVRGPGVSVFGSPFVLCRTKNKVSEKTLFSFLLTTTAGVLYHVGHSG